MKIVIIGGVAAGAKAAAKSKRMLPDAEVIIYTKDDFVSYSSCGLPYYIAGDFQDWQKLIVRSKEEFEKSNIQIFTKHEVTKILPADKKIVIKNLELNECFFCNYDKLIIATGAEPFIPQINNVHLQNIYKLRTLNDGISIKNSLESIKHVTIIGGGFIAIELVEAFVKNNKQVTVIERSPYILSMLDDDVASLIQNFIINNSANKVNIINNDMVIDFIGNDTVQGVLTQNGLGFETDMVIIAAGVKPNIDIAKEAGITIGTTGSIKVDSRMKTNIDDIYACGDCAEKINIITHTPIWLPLGSTANKEGRAAAINVCGGVEDFEGVLGSAVLRYKSLTIAMTGFTERKALEAGFDPVSVLLTKRDKASYMPEVQNITLKLVADRRSHKILGAQAIGSYNADKKINTVSVGLINGIRAEDFVDIDLTYAPPFSTSVDILISAARLLKSKLG